MFKSQVVRDALAIALFRGQKKPGNIWMEEMLKDDQTKDIEELFTQVGLPPDEDESYMYTDRSPQVLHGPPIAAIAFAGIVVSLYQNLIVTLLLICIYLGLSHLGPDPTQGYG
jgi:hypothetical protein